MNRRQALKTISSLSATAAITKPLLAMAAAKALPQQRLPQDATVRRARNRPVVDHPSNFDLEGTQMLEDIRQRASQYFLDQAVDDTGLVYDRARADGVLTDRPQPLASIAATGFGLSAVAIAATHGYQPPAVCEHRTITTLQSVARRVPHQHGFLPHYLNAHTCEPVWPVEYSSIDTALFLAGALHSARVFNSSKIDTLVRQIYQRVDWPWMTNKDKTLAMAWDPTRGFGKDRWDSYSECLLMYLLAIGSPTHPLPESSWDAIERNTYDFGGIRYISSFGALFIHQYPHLWLDLRSVHDGYANYFQNSVSAMRAHKTWCMLQHGKFNWIDERVWGFSASDTPRQSYSGWGAPPAVGEWDGTLSPHAAAGGLALLPEESLVALKSFRSLYPFSWRRYGFVNAFNPGSPDGGWYDTDIISIDLGLMMLMIENQQSAGVWNACRRIPEIANAMRAVGLNAT